MTLSHHDPIDDSSTQALTGTISTAMGVFSATVTTNGIAALWFPDNPSAPSTLSGNGICLGSKADRKAKDHFRLLEDELKQYLSGSLRTFTIPVDTRTLANHPSATIFRLQVWKMIRTVDYGQTLSYGELAGRCGGQNKARAAGGACGANPIPIIIPCHRIVASNNIGGFSGKLEHKRYLLKLEGICFPDG